MREPWGRIAKHAKGVQLEPMSRNKTDYRIKSGTFFALAHRLGHWNRTYFMTTLSATTSQTRYFSPQSAAHAATELHISPRHVGRGLFLIGGVLLSAHVFVLVMNFGFGRDYLWGLAEKFNVNKEMNFPTLVATIELLACGALLAVNAHFRPGSLEQVPGWWILCAIFVFLGFDENIGLHEMTSGPTSQLLQAEWVPEYAWMIPYSVALVIAAAVLLPWFLKIERSSQIRFVVAGSIFVSGALGIEILESANFSAADPELLAGGEKLADISLRQATLTTAQECMEYVGAGYFLYALILRLGGLTLCVAPAKEAQLD